MDLRIAISSGCFGPGIGLILAKVMEVAKEIRPGDKKRGGGTGGGGQGAGVMVCRGWLGGGDPAAICGGNSAVFNQLLTTFLVVAMVWRLTVFALCPYLQFRRCWRLFRSPGAWAVPGGLRGGLGV